MITNIISIASVGLAITAYGFFVENKIKNDPTYKPACDLSDIISCSKPMNSSYGKLFKLSNTTLGMLYYLAMMTLAFFDCAYLAFLLAAAGVGMSVVFAYILYFKIRAICLICTSVYIINIILLITTYLYI